MTEQWREVRGGLGVLWAVRSAFPCRNEPEAEPRVERARPKISILNLLLFASLIGFPACYYFNYFQWSGYPSPIDRLTYIEKVEPAQLERFKRESARKFVIPALYQVDRIKEMRKKAGYGTASYPELEQECKEIRHALLSILEDARTRRIPTRSKKQYHELLYGLLNAYDSLNWLEESLNHQDNESRLKDYRVSVKTWKRSRGRLERVRDDFSKTEGFARSGHTV